MKKCVAFAAIALATNALFAQSIVYLDDFQRLQEASEAPGWVDSAVGGRRIPRTYQTSIDPLDPNNVVFGFRRVRHRAVQGEGDAASRFGTFSTYTTQSFTASGPFEYRGRFLRTTPDARLGMTFFSAYPDGDRYDVIGMTEGSTMTLSAQPSRVFTGIVGSDFVPEPNRWIRFLIQAEEKDGGTRIRARFWEDQTSEPPAFSIDAVDSDPARVTMGRIGIWSSGGDVFIDDLSVRSSSPAVTFIDAATGQPLDPLRIALFRTAARIRIEATEFTATLDGHPYESGDPIASDGFHTLIVHTPSGDTTLTILVDTSPPEISLAINGLPFSDGQQFDADVTLTASVFDVSEVEITATVDGAPVTLPATVRGERMHAIRVTAVDQVGWEASTSATFSIIRRAPVPMVTTPAPNLCTRDGEIDVRGRVTGAPATSVKISLGTLPPVTVPVAADGSFTVKVAAPSEGKFDLVVEAADAQGRAAAIRVPITIDRTAPAVEITSGGSPFTGGAFNRPLSLFVSAVDADRTATAKAKLNDQPYLTGTAVTAEGTYVLRAAARDCAGNVSSETSVQFAIDRTPPRIVSIDPADGASLGSAHPAIRGMVDSDDLQSIAIDGNPANASIDGRAFSWSGVTLAEGTNHLTLIATDRAGNSTRLPYTLNVAGEKPAVSIVENGAPIPNEELFGRAVTPIIQCTDPNATISATLNGAAFTSGTTIEADGSYTIRAAATDTLGRVSDPATVAFTIDSTPPSVSIVSPARGSVVPEDRVDVRGNASGADVVFVNGVEAALVGTQFTATIALDSGPNLITATASDRAGNSAADQVEVTRAGAPGIILTLPVDQALTNRAVTTVMGQVLTPSDGLRVTVNGSEVPVDAAGTFRVDALPLVEGSNSITASIVGQNAQATAHVTADLTPPRLRVMANGSELQAGDRFSSAPAITIDATDERAGITTTVTLDGASGSGVLAQLSDGSHALTVIARDAAQNETRIDRAFVVGRDASLPCAFSSLDPPDGSAVFSDRVKLAGRVPGAAGVLVGGMRTAVADGSFAADVLLSREGENAIPISCSDSSGAPLPGGITLHLFRATGAPTITIDAPLRNSAVRTQSVAVSGTVGADVVSGDVNGIPFTPSAGTYSLPSVPLAKGANIIVARARNGAGRGGIATTYVLRTGAPLISITSPLAGTETGAATVDVSGVYANVDPATLSVGEAAIAATPVSDTTGRFVASVVPLSSAGSTTISVSGRSLAGESTSASTDVQRTAGLPSIAIDAPPDNTYFGPERTDTAAAGGIAPLGGAVVQVNGVQARVDGGNRFSSTVTLGSAGVAPVIARVAAPDGSSSRDNIRLIHLGPLSIQDGFPAAGASEVDPGVLLLVLFSNPIDAASARSAVVLTDSANQVVGTTVFIDDDTVSAAPNVPLKPGSSYVLTISTALKDAAGSSPAQPFTLPFTTASSAPAVAPLLDQTDVAGCLDHATISGTAGVIGARVRLDVDGIFMTTSAGSDRKFRFDFAFSGQAGYHIARVREVGADGTLSPEAAVSYRISCAGPEVVSAGLDRLSKTLTVQFSGPMDAATLIASPGGTIVLGGFSGSVALNAAGDVATVTYPSDLGSSPLVLTISRGAKDAGGMPLSADYTQTFSVDSQLQGGGKGSVSGTVLDAANGRPLANAGVRIGAATLITDEHGRYASALAEGPYTLEVNATGYATAWRQILVRAGAGTMPIDVRLARRSAEQTAAGAALTLADGADTAVTARAQLSIGSSTLVPGKRIALTSLGAQSIAAPLPLGWSPAAAAEIAVDGSSDPVSLPATTLTFSLTPAGASAITNAAQTLSLVHYDSAGDEWRVVAAVVPLTTDGAATVEITASGGYALVYPDRAAGLAQPSPPRTGAALQGVADPCPTASDVCRPSSRSFVLDPPAVGPDGRTVATLIADGAKPFPSGTAVQATIDEQLNLADGRTIIDPPFTTDLLLYRTPAGDAATARFHLAPSARAAAATLRDGVDHIVIVDAPGRVDRGALIGSEGGRVSGGDSVMLDIPKGATLDPIHVALTPLTDFGAYGTITGFHIVGGFTVAFTRQDGNSPVALLESPRATLTIPAGGQVVIAEVLEATTFGMVVRLAATTSPKETPPASALRVYATNAIDPARLPLDGLIRDGTYLVLAADAPIAFTWGQVRLGGGGPRLPDALVRSDGIGVVDVTRAGGVFVVPVPAKPASPFVLHARSIATGEGAPAPYATAPEPDAAVPFGDLVLSAQPPDLVSLTPAAGSLLDPGAPFQPQAVFDMPLDASTAAANMIVNNLTTSTPVGGTADAAGNVVTFHSTEPLQPASDYAVSVLPGLRGSNGAPFGRTAECRFSTRNFPPANTSIQPDRIRITIPDASGISSISGRPGSLPGGSQAVAVRRERAFLTQYQGTVAADGSFAFSAGGGTDAIATRDAIDLHVIDAVSHATIAVIPLTPFTTEDGRGFLATPDASVHFTAADGVSVDVPSGAFDVPTLVTVGAAMSDAFSDVPSFAHDLTYGTSIRVQFDGIARQRLDIQFPLPPNVPTSRPFYLGYLGQSVRGPRVMIVGTLRVENGRVTTMRRPGVASASVKPASFTSLADVDNGMLGVVAGGVYAAVNFAADAAWAVFDGITPGVDLFWDSMPSLYASALYVSEGRGRVVVPVAANQRFEVVGQDASTGLEQFRRAYDPLQPGTPADPAPMPSPIDNQLGPYPVFVSPARLEIVDLPAASITLNSIRNFEIIADGGMLRVIPSDSPLPPGSRVEVLNTSTGGLRVDDDFLPGESLTMPASAGDRIVLLVTEQRVDPAGAISVVFDKPIYLGAAADDFIHANGLLKILSRDPRSNAPFADVTAQVRFEADSGNRRITIHFDNPLQLGKRFRVVISRQIADSSGARGGPDLRLAQRRINGTAGPLLVDDLHFDFLTRQPGGNISSFDLASGAIRDLARNDNVVIVSALGGGVQAFEVSDPVSPRFISAVPAGATEFWAVASDRHGRVYTTGLTGTFGVLRSYRLEDFVNGTISQRGSAPVSWRPGINTDVPLGTEIALGDRPEATPRKLHLALDDESVSLTPAALVSAFSGTVTDLGGGFQKIAVTIRADRSIPYQTQRVTVENRSLALRWSADVPRGGSASLPAIIARAGDDLRFIRNRATYGVVSLFGFGISVFDLNAVESNDAPASDPNYRALKEQVALTKGAGAARTPPCDPAQSAATGAPCPIRDLSLSPEALIRATAASALQVLALDAGRGVLDLNVAPPSVINPAGGGVILTSAFIDQPRLHTLRDLYARASGLQPFAHFTSIAAYKNYALIAANQFGLVVLRMSAGALDWESLVDVVWIPAGAFSVRVVDDSDMAVVTDGAGRVLLVDLKKLNESSRVAGLPACTSAACFAELFPTARKAITSAPARIRGANWIEVGADDPRIIWKSAPHIVQGTLAPLVDGSTGFVFTGDVNSTRMNVVAAIDPKLHAIVNTGAGMGEVSAIVPLGVAPPPNVISGADGSLAAFRIETTLPAAMNPRFAIESEIVSGSPGAESQAPLPPAHLRDATAVSLSPVIPFTVMEQFPMLRLQRGANRFLSPWIVTLADPRAAKQYLWPANADKAAAGCDSCDRPPFLQSDSAARELLVNGRVLAIHPDRGAFVGGYSYLNDAGRIALRLSSIPADTIRSPNVLSAAQDPPFARGALQSSVLLHSGEVVETALDLDAGGRAGWNVIFDRTYRSRTLGATPLGPGWESPIFRRLRQLPNQNVEYRDATGEEWLFRRNATGYDSPTGLYLRLTKTERGWTLVDPKQRIITFDSLGRLAGESDVFFDGRGGGNIIRYVYDSTGRLTGVVDSLGRLSRLAYDEAGHLRAITDWRGRQVDYHYDSQGRLSVVELPKTKNNSYLEFDHSSDSTRPKIKYTYQQPSASDYNASLELAANLRSIQEPDDTVPRLTLGYFESGNQRDMLQSEAWGTTDGATASFEYTIPSPLKTATAAVVTDALGQLRTYSIADLQPSDYASDRVHVDRMVEHAIPVWAAAPFGSLPDAVIPEMSEATNVDRAIAFGHGVDGRLESINKVATGTPISLTTYGYAPSGNLGFVVQSRSITPDVNGMAGLTQRFGHDGAFLKSLESDGERVDAPEPHRGALTPRESDGGVTSETTFNDDGLVNEWHTLPPVVPAAGSGAKATSEYFPADDSALYRRGLLRSQTAGDDLSTTISYPDADTEIRDAPRGVQTKIEYDDLRHPVHIAMTGPGAASPEEWFAYDGRGRLVRHRRRQGDKEPEQRWAYDVVGRVTESSLYDGATEIESTRYEYSLPNRIERTILPAGGLITSTLDGLGRTIERTTDPLHPFATITAEHIRFDADDNVVFTTDGRDATAARYDAAHRAVETKRSDFSHTTTKIDGWGRLRESKDLGTGSFFKADYTAGGKLQSVATETSRQDYAWDGAGRTRSVIMHRGGNEPIAQTESEFDLAGRLVERKAGQSDGTGIARLVSRSTYFYNGLDLPATVIAGENGDANRAVWNLQYDLLGNPTRVQNVTTPAFSSDQSFDEGSNLTSSRTPSRPGTFAYQHEARGLTIEEKLPNAAAPNRYAYDPSGAIRQYLDPEEEETRITNDGLGRPVLRTYADGSTEEIHYDGDRVIQLRDRQGRVLDFDYNRNGQLERIRSESELLDQLTYDIAGRLIGWKSEGTKIEYDDFDLDDRPQTTRQIRYRPDGSELDHYVQRHAYNGAGERTSWSMPGATGAWTSTVYEEHDAMGNLVGIRRSAAGASNVLMTAEFRNAGRPERRRVIIGAGPAELLRQYDYDDRESGIGRLNGMKVYAGGSLVAGSRIGFDGLLRTSEQLLGVSNGERSTNWTYDDRGRLTGMPAAGASGSVFTTLSDADFQSELARIDASLPSARFTPGAGHKIATVQRAEERESFAYRKADGSAGGSQRTEDGRFGYEFDARGRLRKVTEKLAGQPKLTRVVYSYNAMDRMVGRRVETALIHNGEPPQEGDWTLSTTPASLPPSITFVWDPISDQLIEMADAENGRLLRQVIHGGMGYDDPIEVFDGVHRYYPILDEAGTGSLQAVVDESGKLVNRTIIADPYGEEAEAIGGPAVDKITISGTSTDVKLAMHVTEPLEASTVAAGVRLAGSTATPVLSDPYTVSWTLEPLPNDGALSIEITSLRSTTFGPSVPVLFSGFSEPASTINQLRATGPFTITPFNLTSLATLGTRAGSDLSASLVLSPFKAHPFTDPLTGLDYVRARWLDKRTGTFLSPDPAGYRDSANLYAYCGGNPVGCSDPTGLAGYFFDGTWNDVKAMVNPTNVAKLFMAYQGHARYIAGVGTSLNELGDKQVGGAFGAGATAKLEEMYEQLTTWYNANDREINIFGFSRGAAMAVAFANMIEKRGIPDLSSKRTIRVPRENGMWQDVVVYDRYFKAPKINFVGVFDIVGSFGMPGNKENIGFDLDRPKNTTAIRHATAMDENRFFFPLTSMLDAPGRGPANVKEVAFRGVHSDIGGGYEDIDDLAHVSLNWMWSEAKAAGVPLNPLSARDRRINPNAPAHYSAGTGEEFLDIMYRKLGWRYHRKVYYEGR